MSRPRRSWAELLPRSRETSAEPAQPGSAGPSTSHQKAVDAAGCLLAATLGALFLSPQLHDVTDPMPTGQVVVDVACGLLACSSLWWRRRRPLAVGVTTVLLGAFSVSATPAGLLALASLAAHRPVRPAILVAALWLPSVLVFAAYSPTTGALSVVAFTAPFVLAATLCGMYVRARHQLLLTLRERALRAESEQRLYADRARMAERARIAREMHDVLAHRMSLVALHAGALAIRPDLPPDEVREAAELLRSTARQALEELRDVVGVLRAEPGQEPAPAAPQPTLSDIPRLVEETRRAGAEIDFRMQVERPETAPSTLGRDAYRIVQEALTNISKHAPGSASRVCLCGAEGSGLHVVVRNRLPVHARAEAVLPGAGAGLLGLQERVTLAGGTLRHGPDGSADFVVDAELRW
jgi:signal transduction histidine kinase